MMKNKALKALAAIALASSVYSAKASTLNILWYTGGAEASGPGTYEANITALAAQEMNPLFNTASVNTWNLTFWQGGPMPAGSYNVLVSASQEGFWSNYPNYDDLVDAGPSFGNRQFVTGQDADWHVQNYPGPANFNGPAGFLIDAINWAGSGTGMGAVLLSNPGDVVGFLLSGISENGGDFSDTVIIPPAYATFPINEDLTSGGLSNWGTSSHDTYKILDAGMWDAINVNEREGYVTLVTHEEAGGGTGGVPEPTTVFGGMALAGLAASRVLRRKKA